MLLHQLLENDLMPPKLLAMAVARVLHQIAKADHADGIQFSKMFFNFNPDDEQNFNFRATLFFRMPYDGKGWSDILTREKLNTLLHDNFISGTMNFLEQTAGGSFRKVLVWDIPDELQIEQSLLKAAVQHEFRNEPPGTTLFIE